MRRLRHSGQFMRTQASPELAPAGMSLSIQNLTYYALLMYCFLVPWFLLPSAVIQKGIAFSDAGFLIVVICLLISLPIRFSLIAFIASLFLVNCFLISYFNQNNSSDYILIVYRTCGIFAPFLLLFCHNKITNMQFTYVARALWFGALVAILIGIALFVVGIQMRDTQQVLWVNGQRAGFRAAGLTGNTAEFGQIAAVFLLSGLLFGRRVFGQWSGFVKLFSFVVFVIAALWSSSRGAVLDVLVGLAIYILIVSANNLESLARSAIACIVFVILLLLILSSLKGFDPILDTTLQRLDIFGLVYDRISDDTRLRVWDYTLSVIGDDYIFGIGIRRLAQDYYVVLDNVYFTIICEFGIFGIALFLVLIASIIFELMGKARSEPNSLAAAVGAIFGGWLAHGLTLDVHTTWAATPAVFAIVAAELLRKSDPSY